MNINKHDSALKLYNTASRRIENFAPITKDKVSLYACGPTVYSYAHIGNMRTYVFEDILRRTLEHAGYAVTHAMNITDVGHLESDADEGEDKMAIAAKRERKSPWDIAKYYEAEFFRHAAMLNIQKPHIICRATEHIDEMIDMIKLLLQKGFAYENEGNVYFEVSKFERYPEFAGLIVEDQMQTDRIGFDARKKIKQILFYGSLSQNIPIRL